MKKTISRITLSMKCYMCESIKKTIKEKKKVFYRREKRKDRRLQPYI